MKKGHLINRAGKKRYSRRQDSENVIRYILRRRKNEERADELVAWGAFGIPEQGDMGAIMESYDLVQRAYSRKGKFGRRIDHEIYELSQDEVRSMERYGISKDKAAREMARNIYEEGYQVVYAVHTKGDDSNRLHIHFAVNTVNYSTGRKRQENKKKTAERERAFQDIVESMWQLEERNGIKTQRI